MNAEIISDDAIASDVAAELSFDPEVSANNIRASVINGHVTLTGLADTYSTKWAAQRAAFRERGVRSVENLITVDPNLLCLPADADLAAAVRQVLNLNDSVPADRVLVVVTDGEVTLSGNVDWYYQRYAAQQTAGAVPGVRSVISTIEIKPPNVAPREISMDIECALVRNARVDAGHISVEVNAGEITLSGSVKSSLERTEAVDAAWRTRGVSHVVNNITIEHA